MTPRGRDRIVWLFSVAWVANLAAGIAPWLDYEADPIATAPVMLVLGAVFAASRKDEKRE